MGLLTNLTSERARQDAKEIKATLLTSDFETINSFFTELSQRLSVLTYDDMTDVTKARFNYELARKVRKRNYVYQEIKSLIEKYPEASGFFKKFSSVDSELIEEINKIQSVMNSLLKIYRNKKYSTKEFSYTLVALANDISLTDDIKSKIIDFQNYFFKE